LELGGNVMNRCLLEVERKRALALSACGLSLTSSLGFLILVSIFPSFFTRVTGLSGTILLLLCLQMMCDGVVNIILANERFGYGYKRVFILSAASAVLPPVLSIVLMRSIKPSAILRIACILAVSVCICAYTLVELFIKARGEFKPLQAFGYWKMLLRLALPLLPYYLCRTFAQAADKLIITHRFGKAYLARYSVASSLGAAPYFIVTSLSYAISPWIMRKLKEGEHTMIKDTVTEICVALACFILIITVFAKEALSFLAPPEYGDAIGAVYPLAISVIPAFLTLTMNTIIAYKKKTRVASLAAVMSTAVGILSQLLLANSGIYTAVAFGGAIINFTATAFTLSMHRGRRVIDVKQTIYTVLLCGAVMLLSFTLRKMLWARLILAIIPTLLLVRSFFDLKGKITE
jgi:O-antigen/teichoic acid export membrane protein